MIEFLKVVSLSVEVTFTSGGGSENEIQNLASVVL